MIRKRRSGGFSLVEMLLVLAIIGIISGIAIPAFIGQRQRARFIGDAQANAQVLRMQLEAFKADNGVYGAASAAYSFPASGVPTPAAAVALNFNPSGNSKMNYAVVIDASQLAYVLTVTDPSLGNAPIYKTNESGDKLALP